MSEKIKVCHFTSAHPQNDVRIFVKQCVSLAAFGFDTTLVAANCKSELVNGVKIVGVNVPKGSRLSRMTKTAKVVYLQALKVDADIYHFHDPELLRFALRLKRKGKIVIYDAHEDLPKQIQAKHWINPLVRPLLAKGIELFENYVSKRISCVVTATPAIRERFKKLNSCCVDINNYPLEGELARETEWSGKQNEVCYIGGISEIRGCIPMVEAMEYAGNVKMHLLGKYSPDSFREILTKISCWDKINELGFVDRNTTAEIMARSKAGIVTFLPVPNHVDAQPNKMFEYMSAGIPVIGSNFPLWKEIIEGNHCGLCVNPENAEEIADAINYIMEHDSEAAQMGENGKQAVKNKYNWKVEEKKLVELYNNLWGSK